MTAPFEIVRGTPDTAVLYDSPHSGRFYPDDFASHASRVELRRGEDAYVDELLAGAPALGATLLTSSYPRCYIDLNRAVDDIDVALLAEPWPEPLNPTEKTARGLGLIRRYVVPGVEAQARPLPVAEVRSRIERVYHPYHAALRLAIDETLVRHGVVWHVNWHSMKSVGNAMTPDGAGAQRADFVVSDVRGASAAPGVTAAIVDTLRSRGYTVSVNDPYLGGTIVKRIGDPARGVHSVQVEINRRLYLDEVSVAKTAAFGTLAANLDALTQTLVSAPK
ncbi:MAG: N-formylglutamate amidohydrolase [bacterium]